MKTNRIKVKLPMITSRDEAECLMTELAQTANNQRAITAERDALVLTINERYEAGLGACAEAIKEKTATLRAWAESAPDVFPKGRKSLKLTSGTLGFRTGTPKLSLLSRAFNWERVLGLVEQFWPGFIRLSKEVDKAALLAQHSQATDRAAADADLKRLGLKVTQDESFFIEPDLTSFETRQTVEAA